MTEGLQSVIGGRARPVIYFGKKTGYITGPDSIRRPPVQSDSDDVVTQYLYDTTNGYYPELNDGWVEVTRGSEVVMANGSLRNFVWGFRYHVTLKWDWIEGALLRDIINGFAVYGKGLFVKSILDFPRDGIWVRLVEGFDALLTRFQKTIYGHEFSLSLIGTDLYPAGSKLPLYVKLTSDFPEGFWNGDPAIDPDFYSYRGD